MEGGEAGGEAVAAAAAALTIEFGDHCYGHHTVIGERPSGGGQASADGYLPIFTGRPASNKNTVKLFSSNKMSYLVIIVIGGGAEKLS